MNAKEFAAVQRSGDEASISTFPLWAKNILADPQTNLPVQLRQLSSLNDLGSDGKFAIAGSIAYLIAMTPEELHSLHSFYDPMIEIIDHSRETLKPAQVRFRRLLGRFAASLVPDAVVADLACNDGEFAPLFSHCRYMAMDLWPRALQVGIASGRVKFGVVADVRRPPLLLSSLDAFVSTGTLHHLPPESISDTALNLLRFIKPGGRVAITVPREFVPAIFENLPESYRLVEREITYGPVDRGWGRVITRKSGELISHITNDVLARGAATAQNRLAGAAYSIDQLLSRLKIGTFTLEWLSFERTIDDVKPAQ